MRQRARREQATCSLLVERACDVCREYGKHAACTTRGGTRGRRDPPPYVITQFAAFAAARLQRAVRTCRIVVACLSDRC